jgi:hypothetical protein
VSDTTFTRGLQPYLGHGHEFLPCILQRLQKTLLDANIDLHEKLRHQKHAEEADCAAKASGECCDVAINNQEEAVCADINGNVIFGRIACTLDC